MSFLDMGLKLPEWFMIVYREKTVFIYESRWPGSKLVQCQGMECQNTILTLPD